MRKLRTKMNMKSGYHCLVVLRISILYMENVLRPKFPSQCDSSPNRSHWVNINALCKLPNSRFWEEAIFWTNRRIFFHNACFVDQNNSITITTVIIVLGNIFKFVMDIPLPDNIFFVCFWTSCGGTVSVTVIMASLSVISACIMDLLLFSLSK